MNSFGLNMTTVSQLMTILDPTGRFAADLADKS